MDREKSDSPVSVLGRTAFGRHFWRAFDEAVRTALQAERIMVTRAPFRASAAPPPDPTMLSIEADTPFGRWGTVDIHRPGRPFEPHEEILARRLVSMLSAVITDRGNLQDSAPTREALTWFVEDTLRTLDTMAGRTVEERLGVVAENACDLLRGVGWWIGVVKGSSILTFTHEWVKPTDLISNTASDGTPFALRRALPEKVANIAHLPRVVGALEGGSYYVSQETDDPMAAMLVAYDLHSVVAAGGYDIDAVQWLVSVFADEGSHDMRDARLAITALVQAALGFPRPPRSNA